MDYVKKTAPIRRGTKCPMRKPSGGEAEIPTMAVGVIFDGRQAEAILAGG